MTTVPVPRDRKEGRKLYFHPRDSFLIDRFWIARYSSHYCKCYRYR